VSSSSSEFGCRAAAVASPGHAAAVCALLWRRRPRCSRLSCCLSASHSPHHLRRLPRPARRRLPMTKNLQLFHSADAAGFFSIQSCIRCSAAWHTRWLSQHVQTGWQAYNLWTSILASRSTSGSCSGLCQKHVATSSLSPGPLVSRTLCHTKPVTAARPVPMGHCPSVMLQALRQLFFGPRPYQGSYDACPTPPAGPPDRRPASTASCALPYCPFRLHTWVSSERKREQIEQLQAGMVKIPN